MAEHNSIPELLRNARQQRGLDLETLARKTGVARNHLLDIEAGIGRGFHSVVYCRKAVEMVAREFGLERQIAEAWRDEDWALAPGVNPRLAGLEASSPALLPSAETLQNGQSKRWVAPVVGLMALAALAWLAMGRIDSEPENTQVAGTTPSAATSEAAPTAGTTPTAGAIPAAATTPAGPAALDPPIKPAVQPLKDQAQAAMQEWAKFWRARQADPYAAFYDPSFQGLDRHLGIRRQRMAQASFISVDISEVQVRETGPAEVTIRFRQVYRSDNYESDDRKELVWRQTAQGLKITAERLVN